MLDRGECMFEEKARIAQQLGAEAVVVVNVAAYDHRFIMAGSSSSSGGGVGSSHASKPAGATPLLMAAAAAAEWV